MSGVIGLFIWARIDDQRQRSFVTGYPGPGLPAFWITKTPEAACVQATVSEWPSRPDVAAVAAITERD